ncbi:MAG: glycosyl hydrolase family 65 protein, partial [Flavobacteriaceae bacterium]
FDFTLNTIDIIKKNTPESFKKLSKILNFEESEKDDWLKISENIYLNENKELSVFVQQDGFFDKELKEIDKLDYSERPLNQNWSWDRILRSPYIKQADVLQGMYFFEDKFDIESIKSNYEFYQKFTVHESSLSPCIHSIIACKLGKTKSAYDLFKRASRLDLDDYNTEVSEGLHITSMAGSWMAIVEGFAGMRVKKNSLHFSPTLPEHWDELMFNITFMENIYKIKFSKSFFQCSLNLNEKCHIYINNKKLKFDENGKTFISI